jgi:uncharacterized protein
MSNIDTLRQGYEAYGRGDLDAALENWHDDARWENPNASQLPNPGEHQGKDEIRRILSETPQHWESFSVTPDEFIEDGDTAVVLGHQEAKAKESGNEVKFPFVHVYRFRDGKVERIQLLFDTAVAAEALGRL